MTIAEVICDPDLAKRLAEYGYAPIANTPEAHQAQMAAPVSKWIEIGRP
jgi:hypothetical protein